MKSRSNPSQANIRSLLTHKKGATNRGSVSGEGSFSQAYWMVISCLGVGSFLGMLKRNTPSSIFALILLTSALSGSNRLRL